MKNNNEKYLRSRISGRILFQYFMTMFGFAVFLIVGVAVARYVCEQITWYADNELYWLLTWINYHLTTVFLITVIVGGTIITNIFIVRLTRYINDIAAAAKKLANP
ncbi:MAG: hypothetical protein NC203_10350, partial [Firmicutes bacterium]|nr:hypothetical protein [Bacillota bacterium]